MELPIYKAIINDEETGMFTISLVDYPAVESDFQYFNADKKPLMFKVENEEKRVVTGCIMRADHPIYRVGPSGYEYYIMFDKETIETMCEKWLYEGLSNNVNLMHNPDKYVDGVILNEVYFKDSSRGISPIGYEDIEEGSLFGTYKVYNDEVWNEIKKGTFKGFSLEGFFDMVEVEKGKDIEDEIIEMLGRIIDKKRNK